MVRRALNGRSPAADTFPTSLKDDRLGGFESRRLRVAVIQLRIAGETRSSRAGRRRTLKAIQKNRYAPEVTSRRTRLFASPTTIEPNLPGACGRGTRGKQYVRWCSSSGRSKAAGISEVFCKGSIIIGQSQDRTAVAHRANLWPMLQFGRKSSRVGVAIA